MNFLLSLKSLAILSDVLVTPERPAKKFTDVTEGELSDLAQMIVLTQRVVMKEFDSTATQIAFQDGLHAGQSIHVCIIFF